MKVWERRDEKKMKGATSMSYVYFYYGGLSCEPVMAYPGTKKSLLISDLRLRYEGRTRILPA